jgi:ectonucleoside triphosphate diphosphohydrolase 5/6
LPPNHKSTWTQQGVEYTITGPSQIEHHSFDKCYANVLKIVENRINTPAEMQFKEIYAFSYFYDRLKSANMVKGINIFIES